MRILADSFPESRMPFPRKPRLLPSRLDKKRRPIVARTVAFVVLVCGVLFAMQAWDRWRAYEIRLNDTRIATSNIARTLARHAQDSFKMADTILVGLVERLEVDGTDAASLSRLHTLLKTHVHELPMLHGLFLYGADGSWYTNSQATLMRNVNNADREYFVFHRDHPDRGPHIGVPVRSRSTGDWIIPLSGRFNHADGSFAGVVLATVKMEHFKQMYESIDVGRDGVIFLALDNGTLLFRRPFNEAEIGRSIIGGPVFNEY